MYAFADFHQTLLDQTWGKNNINIYQLSLMMSKTIFKNTLLLFKYKNQNNSWYSYAYKTFTFILAYYSSLTVLVKPCDINGTFAVKRI
jgi:hypothetical protein